MGVARHGRVHVLLGAGHQRRLHLANPGFRVADHVAQVEPLVQRDLVVARAAGVELAAHRPRQLGEAALDVEVDVLQLAPEGEAPVLELGPHRVEPREQGGQLRLGEEARARQRRAQARLPSRSQGQSRRSISMEAVNAWAPGSVRSAKRPPQRVPAGLGHAGARTRSRSISAMIRRVISTRSARPDPWLLPGRARGRRSGRRAGAAGAGRSAGPATPRRCPGRRWAPPAPGTDRERGGSGLAAHEPALAAEGAFGKIPTM